MNLRRRITILFAALLAALAVLSILVIADVRGQQAAQDRLTDVLNVSIAASHGLATSQARITTTLTALVQTRDAQARSDLNAELKEQAQHLADLHGAAATDASLAELVSTVTEASTNMRTQVIDPVVTAINKGRIKQARSLSSAVEARRTAIALSNATQALFNRLATQQDEAQAQVARSTRTLFISLATCVLCLVLAWLAVLRIIRLGVLDPLARIRASLQRTTADRLEPIELDGVAEFESLSRDAEQLRRELVGQIDQAQAAREAMLQDAPVVTALQQAMQPEPIDLGWLNVAGQMRAQEGVIAGDWWDVIARGDRSIAVVLADVSGHGVQAGATAIQLRSTIHAALADGDAPSSAIALAQHALGASDHIATLFIAVIDEHRQTITWANAGHPAAIIVHDDKSVDRCPPTGPLLSRLDTTWRDAQVRFAAGDVLFAFSDGLTEALDEAGQELEELELTQWIRAEGGPVRADAAELIARVIARGRRRTTMLSDDLTVLCVARPSH